MMLDLDAAEQLEFRGSRQSRCNSNSPDQLCQCFVPARHTIERQPDQ